MAQMPMECEWCYKESKTRNPAMYVVCTGRIDTMIVKEHFICSKHADELCARFQNRRGMLGGATFDDWELHWITEKAHEFYNRRAADRITEAAKRSIRARYLPYSLTKSDPRSLRRERWVYRDTGEIRGAVPVHGVCVGDRPALRNRSGKRP